MLISLNATLIKDAIADSTLCETLAIEVVSQLSSTHQVLKQQLLNAKIALPRVLLAEHQTSAIGQLNRKWHAPPAAENIYFSYGCILPKKLTELEGLSLIVGLAVAKTLVACGIADVKVKWPNDVYCQGKKIAGILLATETKTPEQLSVIISIGLNVNMTLDSGEIQQPWTSVQLLTGIVQDRNKILAVLITQLSNYLEQFSQKGLKSFLQQWQSYDFLAGKAITLKNGGQLHQGIAVGINTRGHLLLENPPGKMTAYVSGEIVK